MSSSNALRAGPAPTKAQMQEGYDVKLLAEPSLPPRPPAPTPKPPLAANHSTTDLEAPPPVAPAKNPNRPFYGTTKGMVIIAVVFFVVVAAVVGGAVGGTAKSRKGTNPIPQLSAAPSSTPASGSDGGQAGISAGQSPTTTGLSTIPIITATAISGLSHR